MKRKTLPISSFDLEVMNLIQSSESTKQIQEKIAFKYKFCSELIQKRSVLQKEIKASLVPKIQVFSFNNWWRLTTAKYSMDPINASGSYKNPIGGRFNVGQIDTTNTGKFATFPALYLAETKPTAMKEVYPPIKNKCSLSSIELMLSSNKTDTFFKVRGKVHILDIDGPNNLTSFVKVIKKITIDADTTKEARRLSEPNPQTIQAVKELKGALYSTNWKNSISIYDDPSPSQIFGQIVKSCGIEGLLYSSIHSQNKHDCKCLALFLENFEDSASFVEVIDSDISKKRIDQNTFKEFF